MPNFTPTRQGGVRVYTLFALWAVCAIFQSPPCNGWCVEGDTQACVFHVRSPSTPDTTPRAIQFHDAQEYVAAALETTPHANTVELVARDTRLSWSADGMLALAGPTKTLTANSKTTAPPPESPVLRLLRANGTDTSSAWDLIYRGGSADGRLSFEYRKTTNAINPQPSIGGAFAIDTRAPPHSLSVDHDGATVISQAHISAAPVVRFRRAQGTASLPRVLVNGDTLGTLLFEGFDGQKHHAAAMVHVVANVAPPSAGQSLGHILGKVVVSTADSTNGKMIQRLIIHPDGRVEVLGPSLDVAADVNVAGNTVLAGTVTIGVGGVATDDPVLRTVGDVAIQGKASIHNDLHVSGNVKLCAAKVGKSEECKVGIEADTSISGEVLLSKGMSVGGEATIEGGLSVNGAVLLQSSIRVQETAVFETDAQVDGIATVGQGLNVASGGVQVEAGDVSISEGDVMLTKGKLRLVWDEAELVVEGTRESDSPKTGAVVVKAGGLGVAKGVSVGGMLRVGESGAEIKGPIHSRSEISGFNIVASSHAEATQSDLSAAALSTHGGLGVAQSAVIGNGIFVLNGGIAAHGDSVFEGNTNLVGSLQIGPLPLEDDMDPTQTETDTGVLLNVNGAAQFGGHVTFESTVKIDKILIVNETLRIGNGLASYGSAQLMGGLTVQSSCSTDPTDLECDQTNLLINAVGRDNSIAMTMKWQAEPNELTTASNNDQHIAHWGWWLGDSVAPSAPSFGLSRTVASDEKDTTTVEVPQLMITSEGHLNIESGYLTTGQDTVLSLVGAQGIDVHAQHGNISLTVLSHNETNAPSINIGRPQFDRSISMNKVNVWLNHAVLHTPQEQALIAIGHSGVDIQATYGDTEIKSINGSINLTSVLPINLLAPSVLLSGGQLGAVAGESLEIGASNATVALVGTLGGAAILRSSSGVEGVTGASLIVEPTAVTIGFTNEHVGDVGVFPTLNVTQGSVHVDGGVACTDLTNVNDTEPFRIISMKGISLLQPMAQDSGGVEAIVQQEMTMRFDAESLNLNSSSNFTVQTSGKWIALEANNKGTRVCLNCDGYDIGSVVFVASTHRVHETTLEETEILSRHMELSPVRGWVVDDVLEIRRESHQILNSEVVQHDINTRAVLAVIATSGMEVQTNSVLRIVRNEENDEEGSVEYTEPLLEVDGLAKINRGLQVNAGDLVVNNGDMLVSNGSIEVNGSLSLGGNFTADCDIDIGQHTLTAENVVVTTLKTVSTVFESDEASTSVHDSDQTSQNVPIEDTVLRLVLVDKYGRISAQHPSETEANANFTVTTPLSLLNGTLLQVPSLSHVDTSGGITARGPAPIQLEGPVTLTSSGTQSVTHTGDGPLTIQSLQNHSIHINTHAFHADGRATLGHQFHMSPSTSTSSAIGISNLNINNNVARPSGFSIDVQAKRTVLSHVKSDSGATDTPSEHLPSEQPEEEELNSREGLVIESEAGAVHVQGVQFTEPGSITHVRKLQVRGEFSTSGPIRESSDARFKTHVRTINGSEALKVVNQLRAVRYKMDAQRFPEMGFNPEDSGNSSTGHTETKLGFIAQEVEEVLPEVVHTDMERAVKGGVQIDGYKAIEYTRLVPMLVASVKELTAQLQRQQARVDALETALRDIRVDKDAGV